MLRWVGALAGLATAGGLLTAPGVGGTGGSEVAWGAKPEGVATSLGAGKGVALLESAMRGAGDTGAGVACTALERDEGVRAGRFPTPGDGAETTAT
jgi:hypothetical protein